MAIYDVIVPTTTMLVYRVTAPSELDAKTLVDFGDGELIESGDPEEASMDDWDVTTIPEEPNA